VTLSLAGCYMSRSATSQGVWFPQWAEVLNRLRLPELRLRAYRQAVAAYLRFCKQVPAAGHCGLGPAIYGPDGGTTAVRNLATGHLEGGVKLVFQGGGEPERCLRQGRQNDRR
jgi:hypothetical protein